MSSDPTIIGTAGAPLQIVPSGGTAAGSTPLPAAQPAPMGTGQGLLPAAGWLVAFVVMSGGLLLLAESPKYSEVASALAVVIAFGAFTWKYQATFQEIDKLFGTSLSSGFTPQ
jgi:hypothetical protein